MLDIAKTGEHIYKMLRSRFDTVESMCDILYVSPQAIYKWKRGLCLPTIDNLVSIAEELGCTVDDLLIKGNANQ